MSHVRKDTLTKTAEWAKHLRPFGKRKQAKRERREVSTELSRVKKGSPDNL